MNQTQHISIGEKLILDNCHRGDLELIAQSVDEILYSRTARSQGFDYISSYVEKITGLDKERFIDGSVSWRELIFAKEQKRYDKVLQQALCDGGSFSIEYKIQKSDGGMLEVLEKGHVLTDLPDGEVRIVGVISDNTEFKRAENELCRSQKLQTLGKLAAGVAHEINTPIQFIGDNIQFLEDAFNDLISLLKSHQSSSAKPESNDSADMEFLAKEIPLAIAQSVEGIKRVSAMVTAMRYFSHQDERRMVAADINKGIESTIIILKNEIKYTANIQTNLAKNLPKVVCCIDELNQVFMNLIVNASHSIEQKNSGFNPRKGLITVSTAMEDKNVVIKIGDDGTGIPEEIQDKIFDSFFTTKKTGKGTGQGLAICHSIVRDKHKGQLYFETEKGKGTTFIVKIPLNPDYKAKRNEFEFRQ